MSVRQRSHKSKAAFENTEANPYSIEAFTSVPGRAHEYLRLMSKRSFGYIESDWEQLTESEMVDKACFIFHIVNSEAMACHNEKFRDNIQ